MEERAVDEHREVHGDAHAKAAVVHVAAVRPRRCGRDRLAARGRNAEAAEHRVERQLSQRLEPGWRRLELCRAALEVEAPPVNIGRRGKLGDKPRVDDVSRDDLAGPPPRAIRLDPVEVDGERVSRRGSVDEEGPGLWVAAVRDLRTGAVEA